MTTNRAWVAVAALSVLAVGCTADPRLVDGAAAPVGSRPGTPASSAPVASTPAATSPAATTPAATTPAGTRPAGTTPAGSAAAPPTATVSAVDRLPAGGYDVLLTSVDAARRTLTVDVVDYLTGAEAVRACRADGRGSPELCINGYIRNTPTPVRTVKVAAGARITMSQAITAHPATLTAVAAGLPTRNLYSMRMGPDSVSTLDEIYRP